MSREYKFRVWNTFSKVMKPFSEIKRCGVFAIADGLNSDDFIVLPLKNSILSEYTGLEDINKIEIYEGDYMLDGHSGNLGEVKYIKGAFVVEFDGEYQDLYDWTCECVIGNIYENADMSECI